MFDTSEWFINGSIVVLLIFAFILLVIILREINSWYWKINEMLVKLESLETKVESQLVNINDKLQYLCEKGIRINTFEDKVEESGMGDIDIGKDEGEKEH